MQGFISNAEKTACVLTAEIPWIVMDAIAVNVLSREGNTPMEPDNSGENITSVPNAAKKRFSVTRRSVLSVGQNGCFIGRRLLQNKGKPDISNIQNIRNVCTKSGLRRESVPGAENVKLHLVKRNARYASSEKPKPEGLDVLSKNQYTNFERMKTHD